MPRDSSPNVQVDIRQFITSTAFHTWLAKHHSTSQGLWLRIAKKASGVKTITHPEALDIALCYGWIDGQRKAEDETFFLQLFTPRAKRSIWSKINREKVAALVAAGRMQPAGHAEVERAQKDGRWESAYDSVKNATVPDDLQKFLDKNARAKKFFESLTSQNRYAILFRLQTAKKPETRAKRFALFTAMLKKGEKIYS
jgi:uncharacterized protein YdeI (YjbR/CyaY-like superfamily)